MVTETTPRFVRAPNDKSSLTVPSYLTMDEVLDRLEAMKRQEETFYGSCCARDKNNDYVPATQEETRVNKLECRAKMCEWFHSISEICNYRQETVEMAMSYLDRFCANPKVARCFTSTSQFQLAAMTCLHLSLQMMDHCKSSVPMVSHSWSRGEYSMQQVAAMERCVLHTLEWRLAGPTCTHFCQYYLALLHLALAADHNNNNNGSSSSHERRAPLLSRFPHNDLVQLVSFQIQVAIGDSYFSELPRSTVAMACIYSALDALGLEELQDIFGKCLAKHSLVSSTTTTTTRVENDARTRLFHHVQQSGCPWTTRDFASNKGMDWLPSTTTVTTTTNSKDCVTDPCANTIAVIQRTIVKASREKSSPVSIVEMNSMPTDGGADNQSVNRGDSCPLNSGNKGQRLQNARR